MSKKFIVVVLLISALFPSIASACSVPTVPFDPNSFRSGVILEGVIHSSQREGRMIRVTLNVERVVQGRYDLDAYTFSFFDGYGGGTCLPASTSIVPKGQRLVVYLERRDHGLWRKGWMHFSDAEEQDYRVRIPSRRSR